MPKVTLSIPDKLLAEFKQEFPEVNVAAVTRKIVLDKIKELKKMEELKAKGEL